MTQYSYSRVDLFEKCPWHYKLKYVDKLHEIPKLNADSPLILGHALHKGIELGEKAMERDYYDSFPVVTEAQVNEMIKLKLLLPKINEELSTFNECEFIHEFKVSTEHYLGFADLILKAPDGTSTLIDFKYSNHVENYLESGQLHLYKYFLEQQGFNIKNMAYLFIPKTGIRQKKTEDLFHFRQRLQETVEKQKVKLVPIPYDEMQVVYFQNAVEKIRDANDFPKNPSNHCFSCNPRFAPDYLEGLTNLKGEIQMIVLPKNERREKKIDLKPDVWLYADSYVGKTTFWDKFDDVLMINTDGNTDNTTSPVFPLKDTVKKEGRLTTRTFAWQTFLEIIADLETENTNGYQTIVIDLVEDLRDDCRNYIMDKNSWQHESDGSYGKGWAMVTKEFSNAIKRLKAVGLQIVFISKELEKDVTLAGGKVRTTYKPNIDDKTANFLTGTVDITMRAYVDDSDNHKLILQKQPNIFGGGRFNFKQKEIPLEKDAFLKALEDAQSDRDAEPKTEPKAEEKPKAKRARKTHKAESVAEAEDEITPPGEDEPLTIEPDKEPEPEEKPKRRRRRTRKTTEEE